MEKTIILCEYCIAAIRSRGETVYVGEPIETDGETQVLCDWCLDNEADEPLYKCKF